MQENETPPSLPVARRAGGDLGKRHLRVVATTLALALSLAGLPRSAWALQGGEDASTLPVLIDKKSGLAGKFQISPMFSTTLASKFTESTGVNLNLQYNFIDQLGIEVVGGFYAAGEAQILEQIRAEINRDPLLSDMHQMQWLVAGNLVWTPIYGKISFASEWNPSFDLYLLAGGGVVGTNRDVATSGPVPNTSESDVAPHFDFGGGLRIFVLPWLAVRLDVRNYFYEDPDAGEMSEDATTENPDGLISGFTNVLAGQVGVQFSFGGGQ
ncbi:MAG: outer membrane beta-barrel domain-containing protein [Myxococcota bacterium]